jgi:type II secretory pathway pseudopilin PulG
MQQKIGNIKIETDEPVKVIEINLTPIIIILIIITIIVGILFGFNSYQTQAKAALSEQAAIRVLERVYAEAQIDALAGRIRVIPLSDGSYVWISSPWVDGRTPQSVRISQARE